MTGARWGSPLAQQCLPSGQPPVWRLIHKLQGGAWSTAFYSGVRPQTVSGVPAPALEDTATPRSTGSREQVGAQEVLPGSCFSCGNKHSLAVRDTPRTPSVVTGWDLGLPDPSRPQVAAAEAVPWLWALFEIPDHLNEGLPRLQALGGILSLESTLRAHCGVRGRRGCRGGSDEGAASPGPEGCTGQSVQGGTASSSASLAKAEALPALRREAPRGEGLCPSLLITRALARPSGYF